MTPVECGIAGLVAVCVLLALRLPIGLALGGVAFVGIWYLRDVGVALAMLRIVPFDYAARWEFAALPMFLLMGAFAHHSGISTAIFRAARIWLGALPGGLAVASNFGCAGFAAASGSSLVTAAVMGRITIPEMIAARYDKGLAAGTLAAAGTLGSMIPPSLLMVLFGVFTETSINKLLVAGFLPGILTAVAYAAMIMIRCKLKPELAPPLPERIDWALRMRVLGDVWPLVALILGIMGGLYGGIFTATEAAAVGALLAFAIVIVQGRMTMKVFIDSTFEAAAAMGRIFFMVIGAVLLTKFLAMTGLPSVFARAMGPWAADPLMVVLGTLAIYLILGMFLDPIGIMLLTLPFLLPMFKATHIDMIWMGVLIIKFLEIGLITPPVGMNVFVIKSVVGDTVELTTIFRGICWFLVCEVFVVALLIFFPEISTGIPSLME
ncbi:MAG: TRAP transporter large permease [Rhodospirillales bacterium]